MCTIYRNLVFVVYFGLKLHKSFLSQSVLFIVESMTRHKCQCQDRYFRLLTLHTESFVSDNIRLVFVWHF